MTNRGFAGFPSGADGAVADGSVSGGKLAAPLGWGKLVSGNYYSTGTSLNTSSTLGVGTLRLMPWIVPNSCYLSRIGAEVTSGGDVGSKVRLGIYADNGNGFPSTLVVDAGTIAGDSATVQELTINIPVTAGLYWVAGAVQVVTVTQPTVRTAAISYVGNGWLGTSTPGSNVTPAALSVSSITGAFPQVVSSFSVVGSGPRIFVKVA